MAKILYLDCSMGAAGDMLTAALYELLEENEKKAFLEQMNAIGIPDVTVAAEKMTKCGIVGTHMTVSVGGIQEDEGVSVHGHEQIHSRQHAGEHEQIHSHQYVGEHEHMHSHGHAGEHMHNQEQVHKHTHSHHHSGMSEIEHIIESLKVSKQVQNHAMAVYKLIAEAESHAHGVPVTDIHFHEVGTKDAIADITAVCLLMEKLGIEKVAASTVHVGSGHVHCAHGILPVPAPATAYILKDVPICGGSVEGELCTPTGAALLKHFVSEFGKMPVMKMEKIGYGMGKKDFNAANCVRAMLGETIGESVWDGSEVVELTCNLDDMTPERVGFAMERLFDAGALDVYTVPVGMKKSRPGTMLCVLCEKKLKDDILFLIFKYTTTLGVRENISRRYTLSRRIESIDTPFGSVRVKYSEGYGITKEKYEYDDLVRLADAKEMSIDEVVKAIGTVQPRHGK